MLNVLSAIFVMLHGLVHLWYVTLSQGLVEFEAEMGWTGKSWLLSGFVGDGTGRWLASALYGLATIAFVAGGIGLLTEAAWSRAVLIGAAVFSSAVVLLFWDGSTQMPVQKGLVGLVVNVAIVVGVLAAG